MLSNLVSEMVIMIVPEGAKAKMAPPYNEVDVPPPDVEHRAG